MERLQFYQARSQSDLAMDSDQLRELIKQEEGAKLDFKIKLYEIYGSEKEQHWDEFIKDILSITNGNIGTAKEIGYLVIGVGDKLKPNGTRDLLNVDDVKLNRKQLLDKVNSACRPPLPDICCKTVLLDGKKLFVVSIPPSPYLHELSRYLNTPKKGYSPYTVLIRRKDGEKVYEASEEEKQKLRQEKETIPVSCVDDSKATTSIESLVQEVRSRCCDKILHLYSKIRLLNRQQIDIDKLYVDVYVLEKLASDSYATIPRLLRGSDLGNDFDRFGLGQRGRRSPGFEVAANYPKLMILGKPGSGKSTFLRHLAVACCKDEFLADYIPILIELRDINAIEFNLLNHIHQEFDLSDEEQTQRILKQGKVLIMLDGLDEVPSQSRREVQDHIYKFAQSTKYYKNRFILTCRTQTTEYTLQTFEYIEVADFKPEQTEIFARNWFAALAETPEQGEELTAQFLKKLRLPENKQTAELAVTPILLSLTCWVFNDLKDLPAKRSNLYERGVNLLLQEWDEKRGVRRTVGSKHYRDLSLTDKKKLLIYIAVNKFKQEQFLLFEQGEIQKHIAEYLDILNEESQEVLKAIEAQHGLLIERAQGIWSFSHLTFQEYFVAKWFVENADWEDLVNNHITEKNWHEIFVLTVQMLLQDIDSMLQLMKKTVDRLVASDQKLQQFLTWINQKSLSVEAPYKLAAVRAFYLTLSSNLHFGSRFHGASNLLGFDLAYALGFWFSSNFIDPPNLDHAPDLDLDFNLWRALDFAFDLNYDIGIDTAFTINPSFGTLDYDLAINLALDPFRKLDRALTDALTSTHVSDSELQQSLQQLKDQLPEPGGNRELFWQWRQANGTAWTEQLRAVIVQHRNIGYDWQFNDQHKQLLRQYYDANKLILDCLNSGCVVKAEVRKEIEERLLLPIAEIDKFQQQM